MQARSIPATPLAGDSTRAAGDGHDRVLIAYYLGSSAHRILAASYGGAHGQPFFPIFIVEKDTMEPVCQPMAMNWHMPFASSRGYSSLKLQHDVCHAD